MHSASSSLLWFYLVHCGLDRHLIHVLLVWILLRDTHDAGLLSAHNHIIFVISNKQKLWTWDKIYANLHFNRTDISTAVYP